MCVCGVCVCVCVCVGGGGRGVIVSNFSLPCISHVERLIIPHTLFNIIIIIMVTVSILYWGSWLMYMYRHKLWYIKGGCLNMCTSTADLSSSEGISGGALDVSLHLLLYFGTHVHLTHCITLEKFTVCVCV